MSDRPSPPDDPLDDEPVSTPVVERRGQRQSILAEEPADPYISALLARATGTQRQNAEWLARAADRPLETATESAAAQLADSARRAVARWAGDRLVLDAIRRLRPFFRATLDEFAIHDFEERCVAAVRVLGISPVAPDGTQGPNPFAAWPEERLAPARLVASRIRAYLAEVVDRLRTDGVTDLPPVERVPPSDDTPDGLEFGPGHVALLLLLWLRIPIDGRSGAEIAESLPLLSPVGWVRDRAVLLVGAASQPDILAADTLRRDFERRAGDLGARGTGSSSTGVTPVSPVLSLNKTADSSSPADVRSSENRVRRYRKPRPGRPRGTRYLTRTAVVSAAQELEAEAAADLLKTRDGRARPYVTMEDLAERVDAPLATLRDFLRANKLDWRDHSVWPLE